MICAAPTRLVIRSPSTRGRSVVVLAARKHAVTLLPGDGIGPEIMRVAVDTLKVSRGAQRACAPDGIASSTSGYF